MENISTKAICQKKLFFIDNQGNKKEVLAILHEPAKVDELEYTCYLQLQGYKSNLAPAIGVDAFQALTLSINLMKTLLQSFLDKGGKIFDEYDDEVSIDLLLSS